MGDSAFSRWLLWLGERSETGLQIKSRNYDMQPFHIDGKINTNIEFHEDPKMDAPKPLFNV